MRIRLRRKFAEQIDGIDLSRRRVGDVITLPAREANLLIAEGWATAVEPAHTRAVYPERPPPEIVADGPRRTRRRKHR